MARVADEPEVLSRWRDITLLSSTLLTLVVMTSSIEQRPYGIIAGATSSGGGGSDCEYEFNSSSIAGGSTFGSPFYPTWYPAFIVCRYTFHGRGPVETVRLVFTDFDLFYPNGDPHWPNECDDVATVTVSEFGPKYDVISDIGVYCGSRRPPALMSAPGHSLIVTFNSRETSATRGFAANFSFVTDFGVNGGVQDKNVEGCQYQFLKETVGQRGTFTSPNFPGIYPRNTVCHYLFYGVIGERIRVWFPYFDIEGVPADCTLRTKSDFIELSNFNVNLTDRKMSRLCSAGLVRGSIELPAVSDDSLVAAAVAGNHIASDSGSSQIRPAISVRSDANFFRVTFQSNDYYGATGFLAVFRFEPFEETSYRRLSSGAPTVNRKCCTMNSYILLVLLTTIVTIFAGEWMFNDRPLQRIHISSFWTKSHRTPSR